VTDAERLGAQLRAAGLRVTRPRLLVLRFLGEHAGHRSVDEIRAGLQAQGIALPRASVYNVVSDLSRGGLVMATDAGPGRALYEWSRQWHHHFVCRVCGVIADVPCVVGRRPCLAAGSAFGHVDEAQIIFRGRCQTCIDTTRPAARPSPPRSKPS
jgi:Fur family ferric uptake transcriptional regulator